MHLVTGLYVLKQKKEIKKNPRQLVSCEKRQERTKGEDHMRRSHQEEKKEKQEKG